MGVTIQKWSYGWKVGKHDISVQIRTFHAIFSKKNSFLLEIGPYSYPNHHRGGDLETMMFLCRCGHLIQFVGKKCFGEIDPSPETLPYGMEVGKHDFPCRSSYLICFLAKKS